MAPDLSIAKINNEYELCEITDPECRHIIEKEFLKNRISYFIRWNTPSLFSFGKHRNHCIFCVNDNSLELAEGIVKDICEESGYVVKFLLKKSHNKYL